MTKMSRCRSVFGPMVSGHFDTGAAKVSDGHFCWHVLGSKCLSAVIVVINYIRQFSTKEILFRFVLLPVLDPRVGHTKDVHSSFICVLCHSESDWLFPLYLSTYWCCPSRLGMRGRPRLRAPGQYCFSFFCIISFSRPLLCFRMVWLSIRSSFHVISFPFIIDFAFGSTFNKSCFFINRFIAEIWLFAYFTCLNIA